MAYPHSVKYGRSERMSYSGIADIIDMPNLVEIQKNSYQWFLDSGLQEVLDDISPLTDYSGELKLSFVGKDFDTERPTYPIAECRERDANFAAPLRIKVRLEKGEEDVLEHRSTSVNSHHDRNRLLSSTVRSGLLFSTGSLPGCMYTRARTRRPIRYFSSQIIPNRGAWIG